jgi:hypothetical protein
MIAITSLRVGIIGSILHWKREPSNIVGVAHTFKGNYFILALEWKAEKSLYTTVTLSDFHAEVHTCTESDMKALQLLHTAIQ